MALRGSGAGEVGGEDSEVALAGQGADAPGGHRGVRGVLEDGLEEHRCRAVHRDALRPPYD